MTWFSKDRPTVAKCISKVPTHSLDSLGVEIILGEEKKPNGCFWPGRTPCSDLG